MAGGRDIDPNPVGKEYLCLWSEPYYGSRALLVYAQAIHEVRRRFTKAEVALSSAQRAQSADVLERYRYFVGPYQDPAAPCLVTDAPDCTEYLQRRQDFLDALVRSRRAAGDSEEWIEKILLRPTWVLVTDERSIALATRDWPEL